MDLGEPDWRRLAAAVIARREELDLTQEDVRQKGGPSTATMRLIEGALQTSYRGVILARLERALEWEPGSVRAILRGGEPTPLRHAQEGPDEPAGAVAVVEQIIEVLASRFSDSTKIAMIAEVIERDYSPAVGRSDDAERRVS